MNTGLEKRITVPVLGWSLLALTSAGCGTITGAALGGATGAGIGAATHHRVEKSAIIGAGVGGAAGAVYDIYRHTRRNDPYHN
jgi:outer membrane lipoprotein SlyB